MEFQPTIIEENGITYLTEAGVTLISKPQLNLTGVREFLRELNPVYEQYLDDEPIADGDQLAKFAGQTCYMSWGKSRTYNRDANKYFENVKQQKHGSILEHANFSFFIWGIDRAVSHELVRHRAGFAFSQVSQRYVDTKNVRFILNPEFADNPKLKNIFLQSCKNSLDQYTAIVEELLQKHSGSSKEIRKKINQSARRVLPNCTETCLVVTANARALRHFFEMRISRFADKPIQDLAMKMFLAVKNVSPLLFNDYTVASSDDFLEISTPYIKV